MVGGGLRSGRNGIVVSIVVKVIRRHYRLMNGEVEAGGLDAVWSGGIGFDDALVIEMGVLWGEAIHKEDNAVLI